jgi:predicted nucleic acid-binding protein
MAKTDGGIVVVDAGPLIHLDELDCLDLFAELSPLVVPDVVWNEVSVHRPLLQPDRIPGLQVIPVHRTPSPRLAVFVDTLGLDAGETAALTFAERQTSCMLLTDDSAARFAGESMGFRVHGTIGLLVRAIRKSLRTSSQVLRILADIRTRSSLHISQALLEEVTAQVMRR